MPDVTPLAPERQVNVKLSDPVYVALVTYAAQERLTRGEVVNRVLGAFLLGDAAPPEPQRRTA